MALATRAVQYDPPVSPETVRGWQEQLERVVPRAEGYVSHLRLVWEAGDPWDPVERWYLYDCTPRSVFESAATRRRIMGCPEDENADAILMRDLDGPSPREDGYFDSVLGEFVQTRDRECTLSQWRLWQAHGVYGIPWWVIQGEGGGHKRWFSAPEQKALRYAGLPDTPPIPGALPYAPFDQRVIERVLAYDRLRRTEDKLSRAASRTEHAALVTAARKRYLDLLTDMVSEARDMVKHVDLPRTALDERVDVDAAIDSFLNRA